MHAIRFNLLLLSLLFLLQGLPAADQTDESFVIQEKSFPYTFTIRVKTATDKSAKINNPVRHLPLSFVIPDGSRIKQGDVLAQFNTEETQYELTKSLLNEAVVNAEYQRQLANINNENINLDDQMQTLQEQQQTAEAKLQRLLSEPNPDDITIAEGRLRIAALNLKSAQKDFDKAQDRFKRGMISRAELDSAEESLQQNKVKMTYAERYLDYTKHPYLLSGQIEATRLAIENCKIGLDELKAERTYRDQISEIQRIGAEGKSKNITREIRLKEKDISQSTVTAPCDGFVSHNQVNHNDLIIGMRMWAHFTLMEIPDLSTVSFRGQLYESVRKHFQEGDKVFVRLNGRQQDVLTCKIRFISTLSHDIAEKEVSGWGDDTRFGVKVFDIIIDNDNDADWLRPGMLGTAELQASRELSGPSLPLQFVHYQNGKYYIAFNGVYTEVSGTPVNSWFVLDDPAWAGRRITLHGAYSQQDDGSNQNEKRFSASGELESIQKTDIIVPSIGRWPWPKVTWLIPEETVVKKGDVVARLDSQERQQQIERLETESISLRASCEIAEKNMTVTQIHGDFQLKIAKNTLEIERLTARETLELVDMLPIYKAEQTRDLAEISYLSAKRKVEREEGKKTPTLSPAEFAKLKRNLRRMELNLEKAQLQLEDAKEGPSAFARSKARRALSEAESTYAIAIKTVQFNNISAKREYERTRQQLDRMEKNLQKRIEEKENHVILAPADGLICYNKVREQNAYSKIAVGFTVGPRFNIMSIPDLSEMELKVEIPEKYYPQIEIGQQVEIRIPSLGNQRLQGAVSGIDLLFSNKDKKDSEIGLYSSHEPLGEVIFHVRIHIQTKDVPLKPGLVGEAFFPFTK